MRSMISKLNVIVLVLPFQCCLVLIFMRVSTINTSNIISAIYVQGRRMENLVEIKGNKHYSNIEIIYYTSVNLHY